MKRNEDGEWELDPEHFKVICQKCGKVGEVDIHKRHPEFMFEIGQMPTSDVPDWEYHICVSCLNELSPKDHGDDEDHDY